MKLALKLDNLEKEFEELNEKLQDPKVLKNPSELAKLAKRRSELEPMVELYREYKKKMFDLDNAKALMEDSDSDMRKLAKDEIGLLEHAIEELESKLKEMLLPKDPYDEKNVILEIRAAAGGEEAALFAAELYRMYSRYAERHGWGVELLSQNPTGLGGFKEVIALIKGKGAYSRFKYESGVHRVQRVPVTEASGRIHTSTTTVAVLPEVEDVDVHIDEKDLRIETQRASGPGGQNVNKVESAVRVTHVPSGIVVLCKEERSQHQNKARAFKILRAKLFEMERKKQQEEIAKQRKSQVGTGERSEKVRTFNFPQNRVTDHRVGLSLYKLEAVLDGDFDEIIDTLVEKERQDALSFQEASLG